MPTSFLNKNPQNLGQDEKQITSSTVKNEKQKLKEALFHTHYDLFNDTSMSLNDNLKRNHDPEYDFSDECYDGFHTKQYENGDVYTGSFINGERSGYGKLEFTDGTYHEGYFKNDKFFEG